MSSRELVVVYDTRFVGRNVVGYVGGSEGRPLVAPLSDAFYFECTSCGRQAIGGQLLCLSCDAAYLFGGQDRPHYPILNAAVDLAAMISVTSISASRKHAARLTAYGGIAARPSLQATMHRPLDSALKHWVR